VDRDSHDERTVTETLSHLTHGVYVLGTRRGREFNAMSASWVTQVSDRPPFLAAAIRADRYTHDLVLESGTFALSVLREDQVNVATHFGESSGEYDNRLLGVPYALTDSGSPYLLDCLAYLDCKVVDTARAAEHSVIIGEVISGETFGPDAPLIYDSSEYEGALR